MTLRLRRKSSGTREFTRGEICDAVSSIDSLRIGIDGIEWWDGVREFSWRQLLQCSAAGPERQPWNHDDLLIENPELYDVDLPQDIVVPLDRQEDLFELHDQLNASTDRFEQLRAITEALTAEIVAPNPFLGMEATGEAIAVSDLHDTPIMEPAELLDSATTSGGPALVHWNTRWFAPLLQDGRIATGGWDETLRIWDPRANRPQVELPMSHDCLISVRQVADGRLVAASMHDELKSFAWPSLEQLIAISANGVHAWDVLEDGTLVHGDEHTIVVRDSDGTEIHRFELGPNSHSLATCAGSKVLVVAGWKTGLLLDVASGRIEHLMPIGPGHPSNDISIINSSLRLLRDAGILLGLRDNEVVAWRDPSVKHEPIGLGYTLDKPSELQSHAANSDWLAVATESELIVTPLATPEKHSVYPIENFSALQFLTDGKLAIAQRGELSMMDPATGETVSFSGGPAERPSAISEIDSDLIAVATVGRPTLVWDRNMPESTKRIDQDLALIESIVDYDGVYVGRSSWDSKASAFDGDGTRYELPPSKLRKLNNAGTRLVVVADFIRATTSIKRFDDFDALVVGPESGTLASNRKSAVIAGLASRPGDRENSVLWKQDPSGQFEQWTVPFTQHPALLDVDDFGTVAALSPAGDIWVAPNGGHEPQVLVSGCSADSMAFHNEELLLASGLECERRSIANGDVTGTKRLGEATGKVHFIGSLAVAVEHHDRPGLAAVMRVWDIDSLEEVASYTFHRDRPSSIAMAQDGRLVVSLEGRGLAFIHLPSEFRSNL